MDTHQQAQTSTLSKYIFFIEVICILGVINFFSGAIDLFRSEIGVISIIIWSALRLVLMFLSSSKMKELKTTRLFAFLSFIGICFPLIGYWFKMESWPFAGELLLIGLIVLIIHEAAFMFKEHRLENKFRLLFFISSVYVIGSIVSILLYQIAPDMLPTIINFTALPHLIFSSLLIIAGFYFMFDKKKIDNQNVILSSRLLVILIITGLYLQQQLSLHNYGNNIIDAFFMLDKGL